MRWDDDVWNKIKNYLIFLGQPIVNYWSFVVGKYRIYQHNSFVWTGRILQECMIFQKLPIVDPQIIIESSKNFRHMSGLVGSERTVLAVFASWKSLGMGPFLSWEVPLLLLPKYHQPRNNERCMGHPQILRKTWAPSGHFPKIVSLNLPFHLQVSFRNTLSWPRLF